MSAYTPDEALLIALKKLELTSTQALLEMPFPNSELFNCLNIEEWKIRFVAQIMHEISAKAKSAHNCEWMKGKE